jgi:hypothetical protein
VGWYFGYLVQIGLLLVPGLKGFPKPGVLLGEGLVGVSQWYGFLLTIAQVSQGGWEETLSRVYQDCSDRKASQKGLIVGLEFFCLVLPA